MFINQNEHAKHTFLARLPKGGGAIVSHRGVGVRVPNGKVKVLCKLQ